MREAIIEPVPTWAIFFASSFEGCSSSSSFLCPCSSAMMSCLMLPLSSDSISSSKDRPYTGDVKRRHRLHPRDTKIREGTIQKGYGHWGQEKEGQVIHTLGIRINRTGYALGIRIDITCYTLGIRIDRASYQWVNNKEATIDVNVYFMNWFYRNNCLCFAINFY